MGFSVREMFEFPKIRQNLTTAPCLVTVDWSNLMRITLVTTLIDNNNNTTSSPISQQHNDR